MLIACIRFLSLCFSRHFLTFWQFVRKIMPKRAEKKLRKRLRVESSDREDGRAVTKETPQPLEQTDGAGVASSSHRRIVPSRQNRTSGESDDENAATDENSQSLEVTDDAGITSSSRRRTVRRSPVVDCRERPPLETQHSAEGLQGSPRSPSLR